MNFTCFFLLFKNMVIGPFNISCGACRHHVPVGQSCWDLFLLRPVTAEGEGPAAWGTAGDGRVAAGAGRRWGWVLWGAESARAASGEWGGAGGFEDPSS